MTPRRIKRRGGARNPRTIFGTPRRYYTKKNSPATRGDFNRADLRTVAYDMESTAKDLARLMDKKDRGQKVSEAKMQALIIKGNALANRHNQIIDNAGGSMNQHVTFYDKKNNDGIVVEYFNMLGDMQSLGSDPTGYDKGEAEFKLKPRTRVAAKEIPSLVNEQNLPKPQLIKKVM